MDERLLDAATESQFQEQLLKYATCKGNSQALDLLNGIFGCQRNIYKGVREFSVLHEPDIVRRLARQPFAWLVQCSNALAELLASRLRKRIEPNWVLIDAPPVTREVQFKVDVYASKEGTYRPLQQVSPVVNSLATEQFDDFVKRVRIFANREIAGALKEIRDWDTLIEQAVANTPEMSNPENRV